MSLTVPMAGNSAGSAASVQVATPDTGSLLAEFGNALQAKGQAIKRVEDGITARRATLDMTRDLGTARLELEQSTDPAEIDALWPQKAAEVRAKYLAPGADGKPRYSPEVAAQLDIGLTEMTDRHALALGGKAIGLRQSQQDGEWTGLRADLMNMALTADPDTLAALIAQGDAGIQARLDAGIIQPADAAQERLAFRNDVVSGRATEAVQNDPAGFLAADAAGQYDALPPETRAQRRTQAQGEIARRAATDQKAIELAAKEAETVVGKRLTAMTGMMRSGFTVQDEDFLEDPAVQSHPGYAEAKAAQGLRNELPRIKLMTPAELDAQIAAEMASPKAHEYQGERVKLLREWRDDAATKYDTAAVATARDAGMPVPDLPAFDPSNPQGFTEGIARRLIFDDQMTTQGYTRGQAVLDEPERAAIKGVIDTKADAAPKVALAKSLLTASGGKPEFLLGTIEADPVFARATRVLAQTGNAGLAEEILRGAQKAALNTVSLPTEKNLTSVFDIATGGAFDSDPKRKAEILAASIALYADSSGGVNPDGSDSIIPFMDDVAATDLFTQSIQRVTGGQPDAAGALTVGGLQPVNGGVVSLPPGVAGADVETTFDNLSYQLRGAVREDMFGTPSWTFAKPGADPLRAFKAASVDGRVPDLGKRPDVLLDSMVPRRVGESDQYELVYMGTGGRMQVIGDAQGTAYRFRMTDMMREADR